LHEYFSQDNSVENASQTEAEIADNLVTWVFNDGFVPSAKITSEGNYSIISDYLGTPVEAYDKQGHKVWSAELDMYGRVNEFTVEKDFIPFRYQGQYDDIEIGLYYNRFRYYDPEQGNYTQVDPIGLAGGNPTLYGYVSNPNVWIDILGLSCTKELKKNMNRANKELAKSEGYMKRAWYKEKGSAAHHIVAGDDARAQPARDILSHYKIDVNSADNGIYLKHIDPNSKQSGAYHRVIHTNKYYEDVNKRIISASKAGGKSAVEKELEQIRNELLFDKKVY